jgi:hypothetical protein
VTTPERLRRRQRIELVMVLFVGIMLIVQSWYFQRENEQDRACTRVQVEQLVDTLERRGALAQRESDNTASVLLAASDATEGTDFQPVLDRYKVELAKIKEERANTPIEFPTGECE